MSFVPMESTPDFKTGQDYLAARGISRQMIRECNIEIKAPNELASYTNGFGRAGIEFPYYDIHKQPMDYQTIRWINRQNGKFTPTLVGGKDLGKMGTPKGVAIRPYFPLLNDWSKIPHGSRVYFHESAIKAIAGAAVGTYTIGLNGVRGFSAARHNQPLLPDIEQLPWIELGLQPVVVFDSNWRDNQDVVLAETRLAGALVRRIPNIIPPIALRLQPRPDDTNWGFDDARVALGNEWALEFLATEGVEIPANELATAIAELNEEVVWVHETHFVMHMEEGHAWSGAVFVKGAYSDRNVVVPPATPRGQPKSINVADAWMRSPLRNKVHRAVYEPGLPRMKVPEFFNSWNGMGCEPEDGDVSLFIELLANNIRDEATRTWFLQWLAFPLQNLGAKLMTNVVLVGPPGTGKSLVCELIGRIYGDNYKEIGRPELDNQFNYNYVLRQFVNLNEVTRGTRAQSLANNNKLKQLTTSPTIDVNKKNTPQWTINNHVNLIITTNYLDGLFLDEKDRRSAVIEWEPVVSRVNDRSYWERLWGWGKGPSRLYGFLEKLNMHGFDPAGWAPATEAKQEMIESARTPWEVWVMDLAKDPLGTLGPTTRRIFTNKELRTICALHLGEELDRVPQTLFGTQLKAHFKKANNGLKVKSEASPEAYYIIGAPEAEYDTHDKCKRHILANRIR